MEWILRGWKKCVISVIIYIGKVLIRSINLKCFFINMVKLHMSRNLRHSDCRLKSMRYRLGSLGCYWEKLVFVLR
jgi:hypothetical protein